MWMFVEIFHQGAVDREPGDGPDVGSKYRNNDEKEHRP